MTRGPWTKSTVLETVSGKFFDFADPQPDQIELDDIAHGLSQTCRFGGHTRVFYSVAEHSVVVSRLVEAWGGGVHQQLGGLFHDAHEAYLGDVPTPLKRAIGDEYGAMVWKANKAIAASLDLDVATFSSARVDKADKVALYAEADRFLAVGPDEPPPELPGDLYILAQRPPMAKLSFQARAEILFERRNGGDQG